MICRRDEKINFYSTAKEAQFKRMRTLSDNQPNEFQNEIYHRILKNRARRIIRTYKKSAVLLKTLRRKGRRYLKVRMHKDVKVILYKA